MWLSVDPLAEKFSSVSPYAYTVNNPIKYIDPTGMDPGDPPIYTPQQLLLIQGLLTVANNLFGQRFNPMAITKLSEADKQAIFKQSARKTTAILMYEFASGTGPSNRTFYEGDKITESIKWSYSSARATKEFADLYNSGKIKKEKHIWLIFLQVQIK